MQRIRTVLIKLTELAQRRNDRSLIDLDLMLDYTRVLYADLLEIRGSMAGRQLPNGIEPTLAEVTADTEEQIPETIPAQAPAFAREQPKPLPTPANIPPPATQPIKPAAQSPSKELRGDIREYIDLNDKYLFLSEFFGNDLRNYEDAMNHLNTLHNEQEAISYLGHRLQDNDAANAIKNVINRFYHAS